MRGEEKTYDVALSYAGEQREYVRLVAKRLEDQGVKVFFDDFEQTRLWGHDLAVHFDNVYRMSAQFVVPFVSEEYAAKAWPQHEFKSALATAVEAKDPYILPVRFDKTVLPGLRPTIHYLDGLKLSPEQVAEAIVGRLGHKPILSQKTPAGAARMPVLTPTDFNPYGEAERVVAHLRQELTERAGGLKARGFGVDARERNERFMLRVMRSGETIYGLDVWIGGGWGDNTICFATGSSGFGTSNSTNAHGTIEWDRERGTPIVKIFNMSLLSQMGQDYRLTAEELADEIWNELCRRLESQIS